VRYFLYLSGQGLRIDVVCVKALKALKLLAIELLSYTNPALAKVIKAGELIEVLEDG
jgi:hypothetical protein